MLAEQASVKAKELAATTAGAAGTLTAAPAASGGSRVRCPLAPTWAGV